MPMNSANFRRPAIILTILMLTPLLLNPASGEGEGGEVVINIDWLDHDADGDADHSYIIGFPTTTNAANFTVGVVHQDLQGNELGNWNFTWDDANATIQPINLTHHRITVPTNLSFGDTITVEVSSLPGLELLAARDVEVTIWNQPIADHEITLTTDWSLRHTIDNDTSEEYVLNFIGQGWQQRDNLTLLHDELGSGTLKVRESTTDGTIEMDIALNRIWLNESMNGEEMISQVFEMGGVGSLVITDNSDGNATITATVADAYILRSLDEQGVEERFRLDANGDLNYTANNSDGDLTIDADVSLLYFETHTLNGEPLLEHTQFEATGDFEMLTSDGAYLRVDIEQLLSNERSVNGEVVDQHSKLYGDGSFFWSDTNDENGSIIVSGDIVEFHQESSDGMTVANTLHVDGDISGATTGTFGVWIRIKDSGQSANSTGELWEVNRVQSESWRNLTGGGLLDGFGPTQDYNNTWEHQVIYENYTNRTVYRSWQSTGSEPGQGEEWPERSPIPFEESVQSNNSGLGDIEIVRETGLAPSHLLIGDRLGLYRGEMMDLELVGDSYTNYTRDGHTMGVTEWSGTYVGGQSSASGLVINEGVLAGLVAEVSREVFLDLNQSENAWFWENQSLERVLSPSIVTAGENTPPTVVSVSVQEGEIVNEGGVKAHIQVEVADPDWNLREVTMDLSALGLGLLELNDIGQDGDIMVHDDIYTASVVYLGTEAGNISSEVSVSDAWTTTTSQETVVVTHRGPRLVEFTLDSEEVMRGDNVSVTVKPFDTLAITEVAIDLSSEGGGLTALTDEGNGYWSGVVTIPESVSPGELVLPVRMTDGGGAISTATALHMPSSTAGVGGDAWDAETYPTDVLTVLNSGPVLSNFTILRDGGVVEKIEIPDVGDGTNIYTLTINASDEDVITVVQARLGLLAPAGQDNAWLTMSDDGDGADAVAGDGVYSLSIEVREGLPASTTTVEFRGIDVYLEATEPTLEETIELADKEVDPLTEPKEALTNWGSTMMVVLVMLGLLMLGGGVAIVILIRRGGSLDEQLGLTNQRQ